MGYAKPHSIYGEAGAVTYAGADAQADFITKTYIHLVVAIGAFAALCAVWLNLAQTPALVSKLLGYGSYAWLAVLGAFMLISLVAHKLAEADMPVGVQYFGLSLYVVAESIIFTPLLLIATIYFPGAIKTGALMTAVIFGGLTAFVFLTRKDFSWMRGILCVGALASVGAILCSVFFGFHLGIVFTAAMLALMAGFILYDTSNVIHHYRPGQHVAAALALFASVALLLWYAIQLAMQLQSNNSSGGGSWTSDD
jgi:hypothetical protein